MIGICLAVAAVVRATLPVSEFTLAWMHSVEKIRWEEDYRVDGATLVPVAARVRGSGAGMEPPASARLVDGVWHYVPALPPLHELRVTLSPYTSDYELCSSGRCTKLRTIVALHQPIGVVEITACPVVGPDSTDRPS
ncbi:MAG: DUF1850 domain-containing protein [Burkholderiales bacterium]|nr:DUF1850 domain-containing protein [Burkholderiales bacterium]